MCCNGIEWCHCWNFESSLSTSGVSNASPISEDLLYGPATQEPPASGYRRRWGESDVAAAPGVGKQRWRKVKEDGGWFLENGSIKLLMGNSLETGAICWKLRSTMAGFWHHLGLFPFFGFCHMEGRLLQNNVLREEAAKVRLPKFPHCGKWVKAAANPGLLPVVWWRILILSLPRWVMAYNYGKMFEMKPVDVPGCLE